MEKRGPRRISREEVSGQEVNLSKLSLEQEESRTGS